MYGALANGELYAKSLLDVVEWMRTGRWTKEIDYGEGSASNPGFPDMPGWFRDNRDGGQALLADFHAAHGEDEAWVGYVGTGVCKDCHKDHHALWEESSHARTVDGRTPTMLAMTCSVSPSRCILVATAMSEGFIPYPIRGVVGCQEGDLFSRVIV